MASTNLKSRGGGYQPEMDDAERASRDEMMALQKKRLAWSLKHAYDNVAHYKKAFDAAGVHPSDFRELSVSDGVTVYDWTYRLEPLAASQLLRRTDEHACRLTRICASAGSEVQSAVRSAADRHIEQLCRLRLAPDPVYEFQEIRV